MIPLLDLFSGIGGFSLGLERTGGFKTAAFCEIDPKAQKVLRKHWPDVPLYGDIRELTLERLLSDGVPLPRAICGGFPCQDISSANIKTDGIVGNRSGLWSEMFRLIRDVRPTWAIIENVSDLRFRGFALVLQDLTSVGYRVEWHCIPASALGAPHQRDRLWIIAYCDSDGEGEPVVAQHDEAPWLPKHADLSTFYHWWQGEPGVDRMAHGVPHRMDRLRQLGNAVVPQIPELIGRAILEAMRND